MQFTCSWMLGSVLVLTFADPSLRVHGQPVTDNADTRHRTGSMASSDLPPDARRHLEKFATAMAAAHIEYRQSFRENRGPARFRARTFDAFFAGNRFYQRSSSTIMVTSARGRKKAVETVHEVAFDGAIFYLGDRDRPKGMDPPATLAKFMVSDKTDPDHTKVLLAFAYLRAAGLYAPRTSAELMKFSSLESLVLHYLDESDSTQIETVVESLRVTVRVPDAWLIMVRKVDPIHERRIAELAVDATAESVAKELEALKEMQAMDPKRTVVFTLDSKRGYGVVEREEFTATGQRILTATSDNWRYYENADIWLPHRCIASYYLNPNSTRPLSPGEVNGETNELISVEFGARHNIDYVLNYKVPGTIVVDRTTAEARKSRYHQSLYVVSGDGTLLRGAAAGALREMSRRQITFAVCVFLALLGLPLAVILIRRTRKCRKL